ncbi:MAG: 2,3-diketo-5-methylthiopentyl-1-phosphate enolase [Alicyclobacillus sp.]|nr:2,3-diketo-5-methylthiopentyl-1-phosphate enolase [Alicyclobacillus sp.]
MANGHSGYVTATYLLEDQRDQLRKRAESIAVGLTVGSWTDLPQAKQESVRKHCGIVGDIEVVGELPGGRVQARVSVGYPVINFTPTVSALLTTVFGKLSMDGRIRLVDLALPDDFVRQFPGPKFGVDGIRERTGVRGRPFVMSIFKSCIGNDLDELVAHFTEQALGGVDFIKDDEIFFTEAYATPEQRVEAYGKAALRAEQETGRRVLYAVNLTGPTFQLRERAKRLADLGAGLLLLNVVAYGYGVLQELAADPDIPVPIMAHPAVAGALYAAPDYGIAAHIVLGQLLRIAGADIVIYPSPYGSVTLERTEGLALVEALRRPNGLKGCLPAPSAGIYPGLVPRLVRDFGMDLIVNAGGGIHDLAAHARRADQGARHRFAETSADRAGFAHSC